MTQTQQNIITVNITSVRYEETRAIVDFLMVPGEIKIAIPVPVPPVERLDVAILRHAWNSLSYYLREWSEVAISKGADSQYHLQWGE